MRLMLYLAGVVEVALTAGCANEVSSAPRSPSVSSPVDAATAVRAPSPVPAVSPGANTPNMKRGVPLTLVHRSGSGAATFAPVPVTGPWNLNYEVACPNADLPADATIDMKLADGTPVDYINATPYGDIAGSGGAGTGRQAENQTGAVVVNIQTACSWSISLVQTGPSAPAASGGWPKAQATTLPEPDTAPKNDLTTCQQVIYYYAPLLAKDPKNEAVIMRNSYGGSAYGHLDNQMIRAAADPRLTTDARAVAQDACRN